MVGVLEFEAGTMERRNSGRRQLQERNTVSCSRLGRQGGTVKNKPQIDGECLAFSSCMS